jgi:hypothetical protein
VLYERTISHSSISSIFFFVPSAIATFVHTGKHDGESQFFVFLLKDHSHNSQFAHVVCPLILHCTLISVLFAFEEHVHVSCSTYPVFITLPLHIICKSAFHHVELQVTVVEKVLVSFGHTSAKLEGSNAGLHDTTQSILCVASSHSIFLSFR